MTDVDMTGSCYVCGSPCRDWNDPNYGYGTGWTNACQECVEKIGYTGSGDQYSYGTGFKINSAWGQKLDTLKAKFAIGLKGKSSQTIQPEDDYTCWCGNTKCCTKTEKACWLCGTPFTKK
jgi:hypothetical protein